MFIKPFTVKAEHRMKTTERKKFLERILDAYPHLSLEQVQSIFPKKEIISISKIVTNNKERGKIYTRTIQGDEQYMVPYFFELDSYGEKLFPSVYAMWDFPYFLYSFIVNQGVVSKLENGADLMLPGLIVKKPVTLHSYGKFKKGDAVAINTEDNKATVAIGVTILSSEDMYLSGGHGKCIKILHVYGDKLCNQVWSIPPRPAQGMPDLNDLSDMWNTIDTTDKKNSDENESEILRSKLDELDIDKTSSDTVPNDESISDDTTICKEEEEETEEKLDEKAEVEQEVNDPVQEMNELLEYCFLKACKTMIKRADLPMCMSNFHRNYLLAACPADRTVDVKKSQYKKLSVFLEKMKTKGIIDTTKTQGVEVLTSIKFDHPLLQDLVINEQPIKTESSAISQNVVVTECYKVTFDVLPVLSKFGYEKGDVMKRAEVRKCFIDYVKSEDLQNGKMLKLNPQLAGIMRTKADQEKVTMEDGINKFIGRMTHMHEVALNGNVLMHTGKLQPIEMTVTVRSGTKKVTLVRNLEVFGINLKEFSKECQKIGASATIVNEPGQKVPSVLVQGNQVLHVHKLLTEKYQIKKNLIKGLELAPKKKK
ncbi:eukaryotic translation initiation factor 2D [Pseudomyrmex gracilis]|uniref:eukaryotic translation initiation factor 2D n=1 Tax=Pseudomyrmex gracilis TaxID=219809 RepID=UPI0009954522|nr:eukaryotic translation initiation factor 2D [Pseudomyrmex gracilis]